MSDSRAAWTFRLGFYPTNNENNSIIVLSVWVLKFSKFSKLVHILLVHISDSMGPIFSPLGLFVLVYFMPTSKLFDFWIPHSCVL